MYDRVVSNARVLSCGIPLGCGHTPSHSMMTAVGDVCAEEQRCWMECIRIWCVTMDRGTYVDALASARQSYLRSLQVADKRKLTDMIAGSTAASRAAGAVEANGPRLPMRYVAVDKESGSLIGGDGGVGGGEVGFTSAGQGSVAGRHQRNHREHLPPASYDPVSFTLLKVRQKFDAEGVLSRSCWSSSSFFLLVRRLSSLLFSCARLCTVLITALQSKMGNDPGVL